MSSHWTRKERASIHEVDGYSGGCELKRLILGRNDSTHNGVLCSAIYFTIGSAILGANTCSPILILYLPASDNYTSSYFCAFYQVHDGMFVRRLSHKMRLSGEVIDSQGQQIMRGRLIILLGTGAKLWRGEVCSADNQSLWNAMYLETCSKP